MLSKLEVFESGDVNNETPAARQMLAATLETYFRMMGRTATIRPAHGGTLGVCFHAEIDGHRRFIKSHLPTPRARVHLAKESDILSRLYGDAVVLERIEMRPDGGPERLCLLMAELAHTATPLSGDEAVALVLRSAGRIGDARIADRDFAQYIAHGRHATEQLLAKTLISAATATTVRTQLDLLHEELPRLPRALCHGDFGPKNIMTDGTQSIVIDWEDAFWGVAGYDYLYWLTFMDNRRFLQTAAFGRTGLDAAVERAIITLVIVLKSHLSMRNGSHTTNTVSVEQRIAGVPGLPN